MTTTFGSALAERLERSAQQARWRADPVAWVEERLGETVWSKQAEILRSIRDNKLTAVQSCHGVGKSWIMSRVVAYYLDVFPPGDYFVVSTAPTWAQVRAILWRYVGQVHREAGLRGVVTQQAEWKIGDELVAYGRKPADHDAAGFQGVRGRVGVIVVIDEACGVASHLWDAADSMATTDDSRIAAVGNPDTTSSRFYQVCTTEPGWNRIRISAASSPNFTGEVVPDSVAKSLVRRDWVADKYSRWGPDSPLYKVKVDGEFADDDTDTLIPRSWVQAAFGRWRDWQEKRRASPVRIEPPGHRVYALDVARFGDDDSAIAYRQGDIVNPDGEDAIETKSQLDTTQSAGWLASKLSGHPQSHGCVDVIGVGAGTYDLLARQGYNVTAFNGSRKTKRRDVTGEWRFPNVRSASWWNLRELLDPSMDAQLALPPDDDLLRDLTAPRYEIRAGGMLVIEPKEKTKERLGGQSPDRGDAVVMVTWTDTPPRGADSDVAVRRADAPPLEHADAYDPTPDYVFPSGDIAAHGHGDEVWL